MPPLWAGLRQYSRVRAGFAKARLLACPCRQRQARSGVPLPVASTHGCNAGPKSRHSRLRRCRCCLSLKACRLCTKPSQTSSKRCCQVAAAAAALITLFRRSQWALRQPHDLRRQSSGGTTTVQSSTHLRLVGNLLQSKELVCLQPGLVTPPRRKVTPIWPVLQHVDFAGALARTAFMDKLWACLTIQDDFFEPGASSSVLRHKLRKVRRIFSKFDLTVDDSFSLQINIKISLLFCNFLNTIGICRCRGPAPTLSRPRRTRLVLLPLPPLPPRSAASAAKHLRGSPDAASDKCFLT